MKTVVYILINFVCAVSLAEKTDSSPTKTLDIKQLEGLTPPKKSKKRNVEFIISCKTDDGKEVRSTDPEYSDCANKAAFKKRR